MDAIDELSVGTEDFDFEVVQMRASGDQDLGVSSFRIRGASGFSLSAGDDFRLILEEGEASGPPHFR